MKWIKNRLKSVYFRYWIQVDVQFFLSSLAHSRCLLSGFVLLMLFFFYTYNDHAEEVKCRQQKKKVIYRIAARSHIIIFFGSPWSFSDFFMWFLLEVIKNIVRDWHRMKWLRGRHTPHFPNFFILSWSTRLLLCVWFAFNFFVLWDILPFFRRIAR